MQQTFFRQFIESILDKKVTKCTDIKDLLQKASKNDKVHLELKNVLKEIKAKSGLQEKLNVLQANIGVINHDFYKRLEKAFGKLSKAEQEICSFIKLDLSTKEIAHIRNTSEGTIYVTKNRLKNKVNEEKDFIEISLNDSTNIVIQKASVSAVLPKGTMKSI